ncbi:hypothetical protein GBA52_023419 [Prunus armeniaca]|nr:hypothetical protein GBA52_023419 [Prunus armeniaca]
MLRGLFLTTKNANTWHSGDGMIAHVAADGNIVLMQKLWAGRDPRQFSKSGKICRFSSDTCLHLAAPCGDQSGRTTETFAKLESYACKAI